METKSNSQNGSAATMEGSQLREFFVDQLKDIYWAEEALYKALPKLAKAATNRNLAQAFEKHAEETGQQMKILEQVFEEMGEKAEAKKCEAMAGLVKEAESVIDDTEKDTYTRDAGLIMASQKAEHYEIASYGTLVVLAQDMGETRVAELLQQILEQEKNTDISLTILAEDKINEEAAKE